MDKDLLELIDKVAKLLKSYEFDKKAEQCKKMMISMFENLINDIKTEKEKNACIQENLDKIQEAYKENKEDMKNALRADDYEEQARCEGFETALTYVLGLFNIHIKD